MSFLITSKTIPIIVENIIDTGPGVIGLLKDSDEIINTAFDILSLEALFMVPR